MADRILDRGTCGYCRKPVIWGLLQNGRRRSFQPEPMAAELVAEADRFAVSKHLRCVVDLLGVNPPPSSVLVMHLCVEYAEAKRMRGMETLTDAVDRWLSKPAAAGESA